MQTSVRVGTTHQAFSDAFTIFGVFTAFMVYAFLYIGAFPPYWLHVAFACVALGYLLSFEVAQLRLKQAGARNATLDNGAWLHGTTLALLATLTTLAITAQFAAVVVSIRPYLGL